MVDGWIMDEWKDGGWLDRGGLDGIVGWMNRRMVDKNMDE